jgi:hypothetical protein
MSPHQAVSTSRTPGPKTRPIRSIAFESAIGSAMVVLLNRRLARPARPRRTMRRATRFCPTRMPSSASVVVILGAP